MSFESPLPPYNASDPSATFLNSSCLDLLMIELVPMAYRIVNEIDSPSTPPLQAQTQAQAQSPTQSRKGGDGSLKSGAGTLGNGTAGRKMDEEEERDAVFYRLEMLGYRVGQGLVERYILFYFSPFHGGSLRSKLMCECLCRFSKDRPRFTDTLDVIKFLCKDLWMLVFRKQIDNLKTNHRVCLLPHPFPSRYSH